MMAIDAPARMISLLSSIENSLKEFNAELLQVALMP
jgi:hypothetical protein